MPSYIYCYYTKGERSVADEWACGHVSNGDNFAKERHGWMSASLFVYITPFS